MRYVLVLALACACSSDPVATNCSVDTDCMAGSCIDGRCVQIDGGAGDAGRDQEADASCMVECGSSCCGDGEECVDGFQCLPVCETTRCGDNSVLCCDAEQICLDGIVCAASCGADQNALRRGPGPVLRRGRRVHQRRMRNTGR